MTEQERAELIAQMEAAVGGRFIFDCKIGKLAGDWPTAPPKPYTVSLDTALTFVPKGLLVEMCDIEQGIVGSHVRLFGPSSPATSDIILHAEAHLAGEDPKPLRPLALCIAALKPQGQGGQGGKCPL